jgi:RNA-directed DNA polymerase
MMVEEVPTFDRLCSLDNLSLAYRSASKGKRGHASVAAFEYHLEDNLYWLREELLSKTYHPGSYTSFYIHEPKRRLISAAPFRDRVVHHALCNLIEPVFERSFIFDSYANRIGKGTHRALARAQAFSRKFPYVLQCDIRQYFPSIDHQILRLILALKIQDENILWLMDQILASGVGVLSEVYDMTWFPGDSLFEVFRPRGLPIGNLTSQFWANVYLTPFDHFVTRELGCQGYLRFVDDFLLFAEEKKTLWKWKELLEDRLGGFRLIIHPHSQPKPVTEGFSFLGFMNFPQSRKLLNRKGFFFRRNLKKAIEEYKKRKIPLEEINASVTGWVNHCRYANTVGLRKAVFKEILF